ncbi:MAG: hypothetical protein ACREMY_10215, partial [bacterium]
MKRSRRHEGKEPAGGVAGTVGGVAISGEEPSNATVEIPAAPDTRLVTARRRGYCVISTATLDEARRIVASSPHLRKLGCSKPFAS